MGRRARLLSLNDSRLAAFLAAEDEKLVAKSWPPSFWRSGIERESSSDHRRGQQWTQRGARSNETPGGA